MIDSFINAIQPVRGGPIYHVKCLHIKEEEKSVKKLIEGLSGIEDVELYIPDSKSHRNIVSFNLRNYKSEDLGMILDDDFGIAVRTGYHCAPFIHKWLKDDKNFGTVRVGIGKFNTEDDIDALLS